MQHQHQKWVRQVVHAQFMLRLGTPFTQASASRPIRDRADVRYRKRRELQSHAGTSHCGARHATTLH